LISSGFLFRQVVDRRRLHAQQFIPDVTPAMTRFCCPEKENAPGSRAESRSGGESAR
jgi:hypothetical protein